MLFLSSLLTLASVASARSVAPETPLAPQDASSFHFPSVHESTVMARRIMHLTTLGTLVTTFPDVSHPSNVDPELADLAPEPNNHLDVLENRPAEMAGNPIGLMEYYADCEPHTGNPTLLAINIATPYKNAAAGSNVSLHLRWWPTQRTTYASSSFSFFEDPDIPTPHTPAALPRFSLHGYLEPISATDLVTHLIPACFMRAHPDSVLWQPGNDIHTSQYMRFVVEHVYWFGGFGDRARIGWLPIEEWRNVTMEEVAQCELPGESKKKGGAWWREWL